MHIHSGTHRGSIVEITATDLLAVMGPSGWYIRLIDNVWGGREGWWTLNLEVEAIGSRQIGDYSL